MVNFHNPVTFAREFAATINIWHTMDGIFIWEFFTTLNYEWDVIRGHRPYRWTIWLYSLARVATLMTIIFNMLDLDNTTKLNCQAELTMNVLFGYAAFGSASLLIVIRVIAIWNRKTIIVLIATGVWLTDVAFLIYGTAWPRSVWSDKSHSCVLTDPQSVKINLIVELTSDVVLLLTLLIGLLRLRREMRLLSLGRILWNQSLVWLLLATVSEVPRTLLYCLNLNYALDLMFETPNLVIMTIAATRMYRSLINVNLEFNHSGSNEASGGASRTVSTLRFRHQPVPLKRMSVQVSLRTDSDQYPTAQSKEEAQIPVQTV